jgi:NADH-quinone oxidoreductase subunit M
MATVFAAIGVILSACYMLWLYQRAFYGKATESLNHHMPDLNAREWATCLPLLLLMVWMGTYTQTFMPPISAQNARILEQTRQRVAAKQAPPSQPVVTEVANAR